MALLDIVQRTCDEVGLPRPAVVATSTDQLARQMFSLANAELEELSKRFDWPRLVRDYTFPTVAGTAQYNLPADYRKFLSPTLYNQDRFYKIRASVSAEEWMRTLSMNLGSMSCAKVRIYGNPRKINIVPTPVSAEDVVFEYMTSKFATNSGGNEIDRFSADDDNPIIDEALVRMGLKWRIKHAKGLEFSADLAEYEGVVAREFAAALAQPMQDVGFSVRSLDPLTPGYAPENGFGS